MTGQGGPSASRKPCRPRWRRTARGTVGLTLAAVVAFCAARATGDEPTFRLRIEWGDRSAQLWQGRIELTEGVLVGPSPLGIEADEPGSMWLEQGQLAIHPRGRRSYDGVDIDVFAPLEARLLARLWREGDEEPETPLEIPLARLIAQEHSSPLDAQQPLLTVRRAPGDKLRLTLARDHFVFAPGERFELEARPCRLGVAAGSKLRMTVRLIETFSRKELWTGEVERIADEEGSAEAMPISLSLPETEGVYELVFEVSRWGIPNRMALRHVIDERKVQLVVLSPDPPIPDDSSEQPHEVILEIDPANPAWWQRLPNVPMLRGLHKGPLGNGAASAWQHPIGETTMHFIQLGDGPAATIGWEAYPLPIQKLGQPHLVEIEYPSDVPQTLGLSLVEPNVAGVVFPIGLDSGIDVPAEAAHDPAKLLKHTLVIYPKTKIPLLLVTNRRPGSRAVYGKIRVRGPKTKVMSGVKSIAGMGTLLDDPVRSHLPRRFPLGESRPRRLWAGYYDRPLFPENFSAVEGLDSRNARAFDDWRTFQQGGARLVEYLNYAGYNGLMLSVLADGSAIYPSELLDSTPRYDTGTFFAGGQDPLRKDVLELIFRLFDRDGLRLIPALQFSAPLTELEELLRRGGPESVGLELVGADGATWLAGHAPRLGLAPYYNPLNARVQEAVLAVVGELVERYRSHPSLAGVALQLSADGYAQLPGPDWGYDDDTLARFERETRVKLPSGAERFRARVEFLQGRGRKAWLDWRARTLAEFHRKLRAVICEGRPELKLYLAGAGLLDRPEFARELRPTLPSAPTKNEDALLSAGIDPRRYRDAEGIVLLRPQRIAPLNSLAAQAVNLEWNNDGVLDREFAAVTHPGGLFFHEPQRARLESFDAKSPFKQAPTQLVAQPVPSAQFNRRRFVHALATLDAQAMFDGGWLLPLGQESELGGLLAAYRELPDEAFATLPGETQPITIRTLSKAGRTYIYLVNDSPWKVTVDLSVDLAAECGLLRLNPARSVPPLAGSGLKRSWTLVLEPFDLLAAAFTAGGTKFHDAKISTDDDVPLGLRAAIDDLYERATVLARPPPYDALENAGFEEPAKRGAIPGWESSPAAKGGQSPLARPGSPAAAIDETDPHSGKRAVKLSNSAGAASLASRPFAAPRTGWLSVSVWMRVADATRQPRLRLSLEGKEGNRPYVREAPIGAGDGVQMLRGNWSQYLFEYPDLPTEGLSPLRVRFGLSGAGEVWIDDVQLFELERLKLEQRLALANTFEFAERKLENRQYTDCLRQLEGYWPRFLMSNVTVVPNPLARTPRDRARPAGGDADTKPNDSKPGVLDRWKRKFGGMLR
ncbi:MAG TPA: family 10 glycosylhydrolase [Pirellulales bacterium]|nr:family 10 glycosylhydrolase [Pirellulales bacterium]